MTVEALAGADDPEDDYEAIDVGEYYGGSVLSEADRIVVSQLKYSTRHPDVAWTASRLCQVRKAGRSVLRDLAGVFRRLVGEHGRDLVVAKLGVRLVSNQPADAELTGAVAAASGLLASRTAPVQAASLLKQLLPAHQEVVRKLRDHLKDTLSSTEFTDFLGVLELSNLGAPSRLVLRNILRGAVAESVPEATHDALNAIYQLVRHHAGPEGKGSPGITATDVLAHLGIPDPRDLYPAPARIPEIAGPLPTKDAADLARSVLGAPGRAVIAHGAAGVGKTTTLTQLQSHLPAGSTVVIYDCFGGGDYLNSGDERHVPRRFVMQVVNVLSVTCGTSLLVRPHERTEDLWRLFRRRLQEAAASLPEGGRLVVAVDAADNAAFAAAKMDDPEFLSGLARLVLPEKVTLVITARTHRWRQLQAPANSEVMEIKGFGPDASSSHLRQQFPEAGSDEILRFHEGTEGNPRVQFYVLERARTEGWNLVTAIERCQKTPSELFDDILSSALSTTPAADAGQRLATLIALERPIPTRTLPLAFRTNADAAADLVNGLKPGLIVTEDTVAFRDEDFETYIRDRVSIEDLHRAHDRLADVFKPLAGGDAYAAAAVAEHMFHAERWTELLDFVLTGPVPSAIPDGFRRTEVQRSRIRRALTAAASADTGAVLRLAMLAADTVASHASLTTLARRHIELAVRHADPAAVARAQHVDDGDSWLAPMYFRAAGALSRNPGTAAAAAEQLANAEAWMRRRGLEEEHHWPIENVDIARGAEAVYRLYGPDAAARWLARWMPRENVYAATVLLAEALSADLDVDRVRQELIAARVPLSWQAPFAVTLWRYGRDLPIDWVAAVVRAMITVPPPKTGAWLADLCGMALATLPDRELTIRLIDTCLIPMPSSARMLADPTGDAVTSLRLRALAAAARRESLSVDDLIPDALVKPDDGQDRMEGERRRFLESGETLLAAATILAQILAGAEEADLNSLLTDGLTRRLDAATHRWFRADRDFRTWAFLMAEATCAANKRVEDTVEQLAAVAPTLTPGGTPQVLLDLAQLAMRREAHAGLATRLCEEAANYAEQHGFATADALELVADAAELADRTSAEAGSTLFERAMSMASLLDDDRARLLELHVDMADAAAPHLPPEDGLRLASQMIETATRTERQVTDKRLIPYAATLAAVTRLHPPSGLVWCARWDDEDRISLAETIPGVVRSAAVAGFLDVEHCLGLLGLTDRPADRIGVALDLLASLPRNAETAATISKALGRLTSWTRRHVPAHQQPRLARKIIDWAAQKGVPFVGTDDLAAVAALANVTRPVSNPSLPRSASIPVAAFDPMATHWRDLPSALATMQASYVTESEQASFIVVVARRADPQDRGDVLSAIAALPSEADLSERTAMAALADLIRGWHQWPTVQDWARSSLPNFVRDHLPALCWEQRGLDSLVDLGQALGSDDVLRLIADAMSHQLPEMGARSIYNAAAALCRLTQPTDTVRALEWSLTRISANQPMSGRITDGMAQQPIQVVAGLLWSLLGHHIKAIRWRAAHTARDLLRIPRNELATALMDKLFSSSAQPFRSPTLDFYHLSARSWLLATILRTIHDGPTPFVPHLKQLASVATDRSQPHAQARELARRAALALIASGAEHDADMMHRLTIANTPTAATLNQPRQDLGDHWRIDERLRYRFDSIDTLPYWYTPLARLFNVELIEVARLAEHWIVDEWGRTEADWMADVRELRDENSYARMSHRHGSIPAEESLQLYLEYHAMLLAAGELVDQAKPVWRSEYDDEDDHNPWQHWLAEHLPASDQWWLADLIDPIPAEPMLFGAIPPLAQWQQRQPSDFDHVLTLDGTGKLPAMVLVAERSSIYRQGGYGHITVQSALVDQENATALMRALQSASDPHRWKLPDEDEDQFEFALGSMRLGGWLRQERLGNESLDSLDPHAKGQANSIHLPGVAFREVLGAPHADRPGVLLDEQGEPVASAIIWADPPPDESRYRSDVYSQGTRTHVRRDALLKFLTATQMDLIVEVRLDRQLDHTGTGARQHDRGVSRIYLIGQSGDIRTL